MTNATYPETNYKNPTKHILYTTWCHIKGRCYDVKHKAFEYYGGTGITMYPEWINDSRAFLKWADSNLRIETRRLYSR